MGTVLLTPFLKQSTSGVVCSQRRSSRSALFHLLPHTKRNILVVMGTVLLTPFPKVVKRTVPMTFKSKEQTYPNE